MNSQFTKSYPYNASPTTMVFCVLFFGACAAVLGWKAYSNDGALVLNGIFTFSVNGASIFYWVMTALSLGFVLIGMMAILRGILNSQTLEITESSVYIPTGFLRTTITEVKFAEVINLTETKVQGQRFIYLHTPQNKSYLNRALMPSHDAYEEAKAHINTAISNLNTNRSEE